MMGLSLVASLFALRLRAVIAALFLRIVPDALLHPFKMGRIQPLLHDTVRATYVSFQSLCGKLLFAASLLIASTSASDVAMMPYGDIRTILGWYVAAGLAAWLGLAFTARRAGVAPVENISV